jgi:hypothetical protein
MPTQLQFPTMEQSEKVRQSWDSYYRGLKIQQRLSLAYKDLKIKRGWC